MAMKHYIIVGNRKYEYIIKPARTYTTLVCEGAGIRKRFSNDEIPAILAELPKIIISLQEQNMESQSEALRFRVTPTEKEKIMRDAILSGYDNISAYLRDKVLGNQN